MIPESGSVSRYEVAIVGAGPAGLALAGAEPPA